MAATVSVLPEISEEELTEFRMMLGGEALRPGDPGYDQVRPSFSGMYPDRPGLLVLCKGTADVVAAVDFARARGIEVTVRGGGHSVAGLSSTDGGMVIDLAPMNGVLVDKDAQLADVQGGALWADVDREAQLYGLSTPGGVVSDTGVAGLTLGGGYGWLRRTYGLSCDNVVAYEVVTADGRVLNASAVSCLVIPEGVLGLPVLAAREQGIPVIAVGENRNRMRNDLATLPWAPGQYLHVANYMEAAGALAALKAGLAWQSLRRPLERVTVVS